MQESKHKSVSKFIDINQAAAEMCRRKLSFFVKEFWDIMIPDPLVWNWHMDALCDEVQEVFELVIRREPKAFDLIINIPPGTSKSTICTVAAPVWGWTRDASLRFITGSYSDSLSTEHAVKSRDIVLSEKYQTYFPEVKLKTDENNKTNYKTLKGGQRFATSIGGTVTGTHAHVIIMDDPLNPKQAASDVELETANKFFDETLPTRKVDKQVTVTVLIMQRLGVNDPTGHLLAKGKRNINHVCLPAILSNSVKPEKYKANYNSNLLDENRMPLDVLMEMKIDLGSRGFAGQMQQEPANPEGNILKRAWFEIVDKPIPVNAVKHFQLDTAYTEDQENDPSAIVGYYREGNDLFIIGKESVRLELPELIAFIPPWVKNNGYTNASFVRIEPKASGKSVVQTLRKGTNLNIKEAQAPTKDKTAMVNTVSPKIEAGRVKLHRGAWNESFIDQCCTFPQAPHDDELDCLVAIIMKELIYEHERKGIRRAN